MHLSHLCVRLQIKTLFRLFIWCTWFNHSPHKDPWGFGRGVSALSKILFNNSLSHKTGSALVGKTYMLLLWLKKKSFVKKKLAECTLKRPYLWISESLIQSVFFRSANSPARHKHQALTTVYFVSTESDILLYKRLTLSSCWCTVRLVIRYITQQPNQKELTPDAYSLTSGPQFSWRRLRRRASNDAIRATDKQRREAANNEMGWKAFLCKTLNWCHAKNHLPQTCTACHLWF